MSHPDDVKRRDSRPVAISRRHRVTKRAFDLLLCAAVAPFVVVAMAVIAVAIRLDTPGPVVFRQRRTGRDGKRFRMFKFRTMVQNAEELKPTLMHLNVLPPPDFKIPNDPRITRVGRFLRKTSLDELPQVLTSWSVRCRGLDRDQRRSSRRRISLGMAFASRCPRG